MNGGRVLRKLLQEGWHAPSLIQTPPRFLENGVLDRVRSVGEIVTSLQDDLVAEFVLTCKEPKKLRPERFRYSEASTEMSNLFSDCDSDFTRQESTCSDRIPCCHRTRSPQPGIGDAKIHSPGVQILKFVGPKFRIVIGDRNGVQMDKNSGKIGLKGDQLLLDLTNVQIHGVKLRPVLTIRSYRHLVAE